MPVSLVIDGANRHDMKLTQATLAGIVIPRPVPTPEQPQNLCLDKGYDPGEVRELAEAFGFTAPIRARGEEALAIKREAGFKARRWVVERTHSWMNRFRRILTRWEKRASSYLAMLPWPAALSPGALQVYWDRLLTLHANSCKTEIIAEPLMISLNFFFPRKIVLIENKRLHRIIYILSYFLLWLATVT